MLLVGEGVKSRRQVRLRLAYDDERLMNSRCSEHGGVQATSVQVPTRTKEVDFRPVYLVFWISMFAKYRSRFTRSGVSSRVKQNRILKTSTPIRTSETTRYQSPGLNIHMMTTPIFPIWNPKDNTAPLMEAYLQFYQDPMQYHNQVEGYINNHPDLFVQLPSLPVSLASVTEVGPILANASDLRAHVSKLCYLYAQGWIKAANREQSIGTLARPTTCCLKAALPIVYNRTSCLPGGVSDFHDTESCHISE